MSCRGISSNDTIFVLLRIFQVIYAVRTMGMSLHLGSARAANSAHRKRHCPPKTSTYKYEETNVAASHRPVVKTANPEVKRITRHRTRAAGEL